MNEIITFGKNYKLTPGIKVFVESAKKVCDKITVIDGQNSPEVIDYLTSSGVNVFSTTNLDSKFNVQSTLSPYTLKTIYAYLYLKHFSEALNVYLADFTDLYFQKNPFDIIQNDKCYVTSENNSIQQCQTNTTWLNICYNSDIFNLIKHNEILNGGSIFGTRASCVDTLKEMCTDMTHIISRVGNYPNIDQACLNKVVYFDRFKFNILNKLQVTNLAHHKNCLFKFHKGGQIDIYGTVPHVIHQYDVIKQIQNFLYANTIKK